MGLFSSRRFLGPIPRITRRAWENVAPDLEEFLRKFRQAWDDGIPPGFNDIDPSEVDAAAAADPGTMLRGWAAADHEHSTATGSGTSLTPLSTNEEGTSADLARADHSHDTSGVMMSTAGMTVDGKGLPVAAGFKDFVAIPFTGSVTGWQILSDVVGSAVVDVWLSHGIPTVSDSICGGMKPTLTGATMATGDSEGWTTDVRVGDLMGFSVDSCDSTTILNLTVFIRKTGVTA